ncbi:type III polyketide synthase [Nocardia arthritidis]|uniref:Type III polyketide synthase n=1 Tax=Nocardia arthritidis TaxID=228602 RepID=A0A6G9YMA9_9NOCA|nr:type III polyketide synthase [Nocardia arthritidis]QIS14207.1 type III polyketide synthase [Nocardia arthritidis]
MTMPRPAIPVVVHRPSVVLPDHVVKQEEIISILSEHFAGVPDLDRGVDLMRHSGVRTRHFVVPLERLLAEPFGARNARYAVEAVRLGAEAARQALAAAEITAQEIDYLIVVSSTGYMLPGPDAYIAQELGCRPDVRRLPIQQLGCAAGAAALAEAFHFLQAHPDATVLTVAVELSSLNCQPAHHSLSDFISNGIFGDAAAATVVRGRAPATPGFQIVDSRQWLLPGTQEVIAGQTSENGLHFRTDPRVRRTATQAIPHLRAFLHEHGISGDQLGFCISHTGGPRIMDTVEHGLGLIPGTLEPSRDSMREIGNTASVSVFDVLRRHHDIYRPVRHAPGLMVAFGPGFTTEALLGRWWNTHDDRRSPERRRR